MDEESIDFAYKYLVPQHMFKGSVCVPLFIITNTKPCLYKDNDLYKFPKSIRKEKFSFISSLLNVEDSMGGSFYLCNFILDLEEMDSFRKPSISKNFRMPFKHSHYSASKRADIENGLKILSIPTRVLECTEFDVLSIKNKKKLKYSDSKSIIYKWLLNKKT